MLIETKSTNEFFQVNRGIYVVINNQPNLEQLEDIMFNSEEYYRLLLDMYSNVYENLDVCIQATTSMVESTALYSLKGFFVSKQLSDYLASVNLKLEDLKDYSSIERHEFLDLTAETLPEYRNFIEYTVSTFAKFYLEYFGLSSLILTGEDTEMSLNIKSEMGEDFVDFIFAVQKSYEILLPSFMGDTVLDKIQELNEDGQAVEGMTDQVLMANFFSDELDVVGMDFEEDEEN